MEERNTEYADRYVVKLLEAERRFHGHIARPTAAHMNPPRLMLMYLGRSAVMSVPYRKLTFPLPIASSDLYDVGFGLYNESTKIKN
jgi:hypothetical protein